MQARTRHNFIQIAGVCILGLVLAGCLNSKVRADKESSSKPNILLIMVDDMGFSDIGCYGGEIDTPNIDQLAAEGLRYTQFYNTARCCPTRASLMTGQYAHKVGLGWMTASNLGHPGYTGSLGNNSITIAQTLKPAGYRCYMSGKWHVVFDKHMKPEGPKHNWPRQRGFDRFYGGLAGGGSYYKPDSLCLENTRIEAPDENYYYTDAIGNYAVEFLNDHFKKYKDKPFFMYTAFYAPHRPLHAKPEDIAKYRGKYKLGWDQLRSDRYKRQLEMGLIEDNWELSGRTSHVPAWNKVPDKQKDLWDMRMATYAAQVDCMDQNIGRILDVLRKNGQMDNTVIFFLSDNGGCAEGAGKGKIEIIGTAKTNESYRTAWANASNTPFRLFKKDGHEGGIASPLVVHWPKGLTVPKGSICKQTMGHVIDIMPTCLDLAGANYPAEFKGKKIDPVAGKSLLPTFSGEEVPREALYFEHQANRAVRAGKWKLVSKSTRKPPYTSEWELYNMEKDRTELHDLSKQHPEIVTKLKEMWHQWALENNVYPLDNSGWGEKIKASVK